MDVSNKSTQEVLDKMWEVFGTEQAIPTEYWNCPECGVSLMAMEVAGQWVEKDTSMENPTWRSTLRPKYSGITCCSFVRSPHETTSVIQTS